MIAACVAKCYYSIKEPYSYYFGYNGLILGNKITKLIINVGIDECIDGAEYIIVVKFTRIEKKTLYAKALSIKMIELMRVDFL